jgi:hypothetical protein
MSSVGDFDVGAPQRNFFREFTPWTPWSKREETPDGHGFRVHEYAGIYLLAHFDKPPPGAAVHTQPEILYVGEGLWLRRRWNQFERSARLGLGGHSGGHSYRARVAERFADFWLKLHVAALPIWFGDAKQRRSAEDWTQAYRLYVERRILWELTCARAGTHNLLNAK